MFAVLKILFYIIYLNGFDAALISTLMVPLGQTAKLHCSTDIKGDVKVMWRDPEETIISEDMLVIASDRRFTIKHPYSGEWNLEIENVHQSDAGNYTCIVSTNPPFMYYVHLVITVSPSIVDSTVSPSSFIIGQEVTLFCKVEGFPTPNISWYIVLSNGTKTALASNESQIVLPSIQISDAGIYTCVADNNIKPPASVKINVDILFGPVVAMPYTELQQDLNETTWLSCLINANPPPNVAWSKDSQLIAVGEDNSKYKELRWEAWGGKYEAIASLVVRGLDKMDYGKYACHVDNAYGSDKRSVVLKDKTEELNTNVQSYVLGKSQEPLEINCSATANKWFFLQRYKNIPKLIQNSTSKYKLKTRSLNIKSVDPSDAGIYTCFASSGLNESMQVSVVSPLKCSGPQRAVTSGDTVNLSCSLPLLGQHGDWELEWTVDGIPLAGAAHNNRLQMNRLLQFSVLYVDSANEYVCTATNSKLHFTSSCNYTLLVHVMNPDIYCDVSTSTASSSIILCLAAAFVIIIIIFIIIIGCIIISYEKKSNSLYRSKNDSYRNRDSDNIEMKPLTE